MELAVDVELDLPKVWTCVAELVSSTLHASAGKVGLNSLKEMAAPLLPFDKADIFLAEILKQIIKEQTVSCQILHFDSADFYLTCWSSTKTSPL